MALGFDQVAVRRAAVVRFATEAPGGEHQVTQLARFDRLLGPLHRLCVTVVEVDGKEGAPLGGFSQQDVGLSQLEHEGRQQPAAGQPLTSCLLGDENVAGFAGQEELEALLDPCQRAAAEGL